MTVSSSLHQVFARVRALGHVPYAATSAELPTILTTSAMMSVS